MPFAKEQKFDEQLPAAAGSRPPTPTAASRMKQLRPGTSKSFGSLSSKSNDNVAALESDSPQRGSPGSASFSSSRRASDDKSQSLKQKLASKVKSKLHRSHSEEGSGRGRNLFLAASDAMNSNNFRLPSDSSLQDTASFGNLLSLTSDGASLYRKASESWNFGTYPTEAEAYELQEAVGEGATATVYLAYCPSMDMDVAIKIVNLDEKSINLPSIVAEVQTMKLLKHPNILPLYAAFLDDDQLWMVMPYVAGGSASDIMRRTSPNGLNEHCIATIMKPVCSALAYLHKDGYIHRDLKAGNILIDHQGQVILADMGIATAMTRSHRLHEGGALDSQPQRATNAGDMAAYLSRTTFAGTPCWMAPEVMEEGQPYDCSADIWSLGITLLEFALGQAPLQNCNLDQILMKTLNEPPPILESADRRKRFTEDLQELVSHCLQKEPAERWTARQLLKHRFWKAAYDGSYLAKQLDIGTGAALATDTGAAKTIGRALVGAARVFTDKTQPITGEEVDARDAFKLLRRVMLPPQWLPEGSEPLEVSAVKSAKGLAFGMLKSTGTGVKFLRGSGFIIGRSVNSRRETRWSAPSYFHMDIRGLPPSFRDMEEVHVVMVLPSWEALGRMKADEVDLAADDDDAEGGDGMPDGSPPKAGIKRLGKSLFGSTGLGNGVFGSHGSVGKLVRRHTMDSDAMQEASGSGRHGNSSGRHGSGSSTRMLPDRPEVGYCVQPNSQRVFQIPLQGAVVRLDKKQNAELYGEGSSPDQVLNIQLTKRPPPFDRLVKDIEQLVEGAPQPDQRPEDSQWFKNEYFFQ